MPTIPSKLFEAFPVGAVLRGPNVGTPPWAEYMPYWAYHRVVRHVYGNYTGDAALVTEIEVSGTHDTSEMEEILILASDVIAHWKRVPESFELLVNLDRFLRTEGKQALRDPSGKIVITSCR